MRSGSGTFETCPPTLRRSVTGVDRKSPWSGQTDAIDPKRNWCGFVGIEFPVNLPTDIKTLRIHLQVLPA